MAKLYFHYSTMNAGKSTLLLQAAHNYQERGMTVMLFTAALDDRAGLGRIASRIGLARDAERFADGDDLFERVRQRLEDHGPLHCLFVDEAQFLAPEQVWQLARVADRLDVPVMAYGLRTDFRGALFPGSRELLAIADDLREVRTICRCGRKASMVVRLGPDGKVMRDGAQVVIGGEERYVSLCRRHWEEEMGRWKAEDLVGFTGN
ncbi:thymidine kinase [Zhengella mangrovi]|uniref:Thymidine kinase n=1 Tax=Zhengella mangrovi TaxID=1982044 RepID=A0A2G1QP70_9HYPH|nr:thymidine kinase [Zhengella mangrovi]PHP67313.1 thymidine kinase [Zhengella mangrovi]